MTRRQSDLPRPTIEAVAKGILGGICLGIWGAILFYGLPWVLA